MNSHTRAAALMAAALFVRSHAAAQDRPGISFAPASPRLWDVSGDAGLAAALD